mmetsp:Transcript_11187/g.13547  ORF Transcript_11187/g.13547 Transcript_11187/m.13547 type:complete len:179 (+) Transcript_11187:220-756(+)
MTLVGSPRLARLLRLGNVRTPVKFPPKSRGNEVCSRSFTSSARGTKREDYTCFVSLQTRWNDMDSFNHINNVIYYQFMDDAVNKHLLDNNVGIEHTRFVASSSCQYLKPISYPGDVDVGLRVSKLGNSSVTYDIGIFASDDISAAAKGSYVHVYIDSDLERPAPIQKEVRKVLSSLEK